MAKNKELPTFEQALSKLEGIVKNLGDQGVPLAEALEQFEEGIGHIAVGHFGHERIVDGQKRMSNALSDGR